MSLIHMLLSNTSDTEMDDRYLATPLIQLQSDTQAELLDISGSKDIFRR